LSSHRCIHGGGIVRGKEASLQLSDPVKALGERQSRVTRQTLLEPKLIEPLIVEGAKFRAQPPKGPNKPELRGDNVDDKAKPSLLRERETAFGFTLHFHERISCRKKIRVHVIAAVRSETKVTDLVRGVERPLYYLTAIPDMLRPWHDVTSEQHVSPGLEAFQSALFDEFIAETAEFKSDLVIAEVRAGYHPKVYVREARPVTVTILDAEVNGSAD
jgi:hypothetical protein